MNLRKIISLLAITMSLASCGTMKKIVYFQDQKIGQEEPVLRGKYITLQPQDQISVIVSSKDAELASIFNLSKATSGGASDNQNIPYTVDDNGYIDFPVLGTLQVQGLTRQQVSELIKTKLRENLVKDAVVTVNFANLSFSALGEVASPGKYDIKKDQITILEALSMAGDLTILGLRDKVFLIRTGDTRVTYQLDLRSEEIFNSPAYYVQQNDVIYVEPNGVRANQSTVNGNVARSASFWMSVTSFLMTIGILIFK